MERISPARKIAFNILLAVERGKAHSDELLRGDRVNALAAADRNLATALVLGVLRRQLELDAQIRPLLKRPNAKLDPEILIALRLGAFQLLHLDRIPAHAAIAESVELAKQAGHNYAAGMVNALLRRLSRSEVSDPAPAGQVLGQPTSAHLVPAHLSSPHPASPHPASPHPASPHPASPHPASPHPASPHPASPHPASAHPLWMVERWRAFYGADAANAICAHGQSQPLLSLRVAASQIEAELAEAGIELAPGSLLSDARTVLRGDVTATPAFRAGRIRIQDEGSQLVAEIAASMAAALNPNTMGSPGIPGPQTPSPSVLDLCAAPGGKTLLLAERLPAARIVACEASPQRLAAMRERLSAFAAGIDCRLVDATALNTAALDDTGPGSAFDLVLADVPCSGTGTLGRNPEIRHRLRVDDLPRQAERQKAILHAALRALRPGGRVVYSTCSLEPEENEQVVAAVLAETPAARLVPLADSIRELQRRQILTSAASEQLAGSITAEGALRLLPGAFGTDGFFVAAIEKTASPAGSHTIICCDET